MGTDIFLYALLYIIIFMTITGISWLFMKMRCRRARERIRRNIDLIKQRGNI